MESLKIKTNKSTLVDQVEDNLIQFFSEHNLKLGSQLPSEKEIAEELGVARSVLRETLSRFKMVGMIRSRPRRGMVIAEPSIFSCLRRVTNPLWLTESTLIDILEFRVALEIGLSFSIFRNITDEDIEELREIVSLGIVVGDNKYSPVSEFNFHTKLYEISGNRLIKEFQEIIHPVLNFVKDNSQSFFEPISIEMKKNNELVTHEDLLILLQKRDINGYDKAIRLHFKPYTEFLSRRQNN